MGTAAACARVQGGHAKEGDSQMRVSLLTGLLIAAAATVMVGCASAGSDATSTAAISPSTSPANSLSASPRNSLTPLPPSSPGRVSPCGPPAVPAAGNHVLTLTSAQDGKTYCVATGTNLLVLLRGTPENKWRAIRVSGSSLRPSASGRTTLMIGVTGASFLAIRPGTSVISSARPVCSPSATSATAPCDAVRAFHVTVIVRAS